MQRISQFILMLIALAISAVAFATAQTPDTIILNGQEYSLNTNPLTLYLREKKWTRPEDAVVSSANWRGYTAVWEIVDHQLMLKDVTIRINIGKDRYAKKSILRDLFPNSETIVATWYSGALIIPDGEMTQYVHMGYGSMHSHYQIVRVKHGQVEEQLSLSEDEFRKYKQVKFQEFMKTSEYEKSLAELLKDGTDMSPDELKDFMMSFYAETYLAL